MSQLKANAAALAAGSAPPANGNGADPDPSTPPPVPVPTEPGDDHVPDLVPAVVAWNRVMRDVRAINKGDQFSGGASGQFAFRGADRVLYHFGPAVRRHGVIVIAHKIDKEYGSVSTKNGGAMRQCDVTVTWRIYGPAGDFFEAQSAGEGLDTGGRSTSKAQTVALRVLLLTGGLVPTEDADPESQNIERGEAPIRSAVQYLDEVLDPGTSVQRLYMIHRELAQHRMLNAVVTNEVGDDEPLGALVKRIGTERKAGA